VREILPVRDTGADARERRKMIRSRVTLVVDEPVGRMHDVESIEHRVARSLGEDRGCRDHCGDNA